MSRHAEHDDVRSTILCIAADMFAACGVHASGIAEIAKVANLSKGTLYYYYPTKDGLICDVCDMHFSELSNTMLDWLSYIKTDTTLTSAMDNLVSNLVKSDVALHVALCCEAARNNEPLQNIVDKWYNELSVVLEIGLLKMTSVSFNGNRCESRLFFTLLDGYLLQNAMGISPFGIDTFIQIVISIFD